MSKRLLVISQVYPPDPASVGQHIADAAEEMVTRGWSVRVLTAGRGYDVPSRRYRRREERNGVTVRRLPLSSFGKGTVWRRLLGQSIFSIQAGLHGLTGPSPDLVLVTTSPVMGSAIGLWLSLIRRIPMAYWAMDINPDQAVAAAKASADSLAVRIFDRVNRIMLRRAAVVITLDRFMARTLEAKTPAVTDKLRIVPPWPHESHLERVEHDDNPFRARHGLDGKFVVMYSGNHSLVHPLTTLLEAARALEDRSDIVFLFIGGGEGKAEVVDFVRTHSLANARLLPYQPLEEIRFSLSAADIHVVSMGTEMVGLVHPCKFYGAMALARPVLCFGPAESHVSDVIRDTGCGWLVEHGDVAGTVSLIRRLADSSPARIEEIGSNGRGAVTRALGERVLRARFADILDEAAR